MKDEYGNEHSPLNGQFISQSDGATAKQKIASALDKLDSAKQVQQKNAQKFIGKITTDIYEKTTNRSIANKEIVLTNNYRKHIINSGHIETLNEYENQIPALLNKPENIYLNKDKGRHGEERYVVIARPNRRINLVIEIESAETQNGEVSLVTIFPIKKRDIVRLGKKLKRVY